MQWNVALLMLPLAGLVLAGCADESSELDPSDRPDPTLVTSPDDYDYVGNATTDHVHDYWRAADRLTVMDEPHADLGPGYAGSAEPYPVHVYVPPADHVVPLGTASLEVTLTWTDDMLDHHGAAELWYQSAAMDEPIKAADIDSGDLVTINVTQDDADLPHQRLSAWRFELRMAPGDLGFIRFKVETNILVEAVRGLEIPLFPGHPDLWNGQTEIGLFESEHTLAYFHDLQDGGCNGFSCPQEHSADDGVVVPFDADEVIVTLETDGSPTAIVLRYHSAASREWTVLAPTEQAGNVQTYVIPLESDGDGPYALQSLWRFSTHITEPIDGGVAYTSYTMTASAHRAA